MKLENVALTTNKNSQLQFKLQRSKDKARIKQKVKNLLYKLFI